MNEMIREWLESRFERYRVDGEPKQGTYGLVWFMAAADERVNPQRFALKTLDPSKQAVGRDQANMQNFERELRIWLEIPPHCNVLPALGIELAVLPGQLALQTPAWPLVRMPRCDGTLREWIDAPVDKVDLVDRLTAIAQLCNGLAWLTKSVRTTSQTGQDADFTVRLALTRVP